MRYRVVKDGETVVDVVTESYEGLGPFGEHVERPEVGRVELWLDDELVGVQEPHDETFEALHLLQQMAEGRA